MSMAVKIEARKNYRARSGKIFSDARRHSAIPGVWALVSRSGYPCLFYDNGLFYERGSDEVHDFDLIEEIAVEEPQPLLAQQKDEPAWKQDGGKARIDLVAPEFITGTAEVLAFGAAKYAERNWEKGMSWGRCFGALMRHMWAWWAGERFDRETGMSHLWHASCCLMFLVAYEARELGTDDRGNVVDHLS